MNGMTEQTDKKRIDLKTTQVAAGSLASVTSAVAASQLGVAGTLVGAGVGSVIGTVAGAVYQHYLDRTHDQVRSAVPRRILRNETATDDATTEAEAIETELPKEPTWSWLRSRRMALGASAAVGLGIALVALTGFEAVTGQPVSAGSDRGTSVGQVFGGSSSGSAVDPSTTPTSDQVTEGVSPPPSPNQDSPSTTSTSPASTPPSTSSTSPSTEPTPQTTPPNLG